MRDDIAERYLSALEEASHDTAKLDELHGQLLAGGEVSIQGLNACLRGCTHVEHSHLTTRIRAICEVLSEIASREGSQANPCGNLRALAEMRLLALAMETPFATRMELLRHLDVEKDVQLRGVLCEMLESPIAGVDDKLAAARLLVDSGQVSEALEYALKLVRDESGQGESVEGHDRSPDGYFLLCSIAERDDRALQFVLDGLSRAQDTQTERAILRALESRVGPEHARKVQLSDALRAYVEGMLAGVPEVDDENLDLALSILKKLHWMPDCEVDRLADRFNERFGRNTLDIHCAGNVLSACSGSSPPQTGSPAEDHVSAERKDLEQPAPDPNRRGSTLQDEREFALATLVTAGAVALVCASALWRSRRC